MVYNNLNWDAATASLERSLSVSFATRYIQLTKVTSSCEEERRVGDGVTCDDDARWR